MIKHILRKIVRPKQAGSLKRVSSYHSFLFSSYILNSSNKFSDITLDTGMCRWHFDMPKILEGSITILSDVGLGMAMFSLGELVLDYSLISLFFILKDKTFC